MCRSCTPSMLTGMRIRTQNEDKRSWRARWQLLSKVGVFDHTLGVDSPVQQHVGDVRRAVTFDSIGSSTGDHRSSSVCGALATAGMSGEGSAGTVGPG